MPSVRRHIARKTGAPTPFQQRQGILSDGKNPHPQQALCIFHRTVKRRQPRPRPHVAGPTAPPHHRPYRPHRRSAPPSVARPSAAPILKKHPRDRPATFLLSPTPPPTLLPDTGQRNPAYLPGAAPKIRSYRPLRCNLETRAAIRGGRSCVPSDAPQSKSRKTVLQSTVPPLHRNTPTADPTTPSYRNQSAGK